MLQPGDNDQPVDVCGQSRPMSQGLGGQEQGSHHVWPWVSSLPHGHLASPLNWAVETARAKTR